MNKYLENPKTKESGIYCVIPQEGKCPNRCDDCFFQSGRSYLEPLEENLPNMADPTKHMFNVIRVNDGNDSFVNQKEVIAATKKFPMHFFNTSFPGELEKYDNPVVVTINPGNMTDTEWFKIDPIPKNLMFVRFRTNTWNYCQQVEAITYYYAKGIPIILTFMAYHDVGSIPVKERDNYIYRKRILNEYWAIKTEAFHKVMGWWRNNQWVHSCGKIEGELGNTTCRHCGNCLREYFATIERMRGPIY